MLGLNTIELIVIGVGAASFAGLIGGGIYHIQSQAKEQAVIEQNARIMEQAKKDAEEVARQKEVEAIDARKREAAAMARNAAKDRELANYRSRLAALVRRDPVVREWAATPIPPTVVACVLGLADCAAGGDQSNGAPAAADGTVAADHGAELAIEPNERGSGRVWSGLRYRGESLQRGQGGHSGLVSKAARDRTDRSSGSSQAATGAAVAR